MAADKIEVTITIDKTEAARLEEIVRALKARGLDRVESHPRFMIINGSVSLTALDSLRTVKGVASIRRDQLYKPQSR